MFLMPVGGWRQRESFTGPFQRQTSEVIAKEWFSHWPLTPLFISSPSFRTLFVPKHVGSPEHKLPLYAESSRDDRNGIQDETKILKRFCDSQNIIGRRLRERMYYEAKRCQGFGERLRHRIRRWGRGEGGSCCQEIERSHHVVFSSIFVSRFGVTQIHPCGSL
ncbi:hypothetical protein PoB_001864600 [Plakobranchus ocellatus]|uniref:Uncharacterized protein n=1 Tax=Plakobranchus ocellatus TaxID=259542 RepID=A0AAV3ZBV2_9GAST|nr:hypothetical protein PoB_001864600 [Plakobranchus ocellatus]